ncbi:MAG: response regulator transcription factor [Victivallales bacterium]|nr:response regulator transcription factor [Victivallales bacterium]
MKILLIEDDQRTAAFIIKGLKQEGYTPEHAADGVDGLFRAATEDYDLLIIDIMLPQLDGLSVIAELRRKKITTPIIVLSARSSVEDRITGLQQGGDDYLVKPFAFSELLARIQALIRRTHAIAEPTTLAVGDLRIDLLGHKVFRGQDRIDIQPLEYALLEYLMRHAGRVVSKTMIMEHVWEYNFDPQTNIVETRICRLRDKIDRPYSTQLIHTVRGFGYVLEERHPHHQNG